MKKGVLNNITRSLGTLIGAFLLVSAAFGLAPQSAQAVTWLPTAAIVEAVQDLREFHEDLDSFADALYPLYLLDADNFVLHLDDFEDLDDAGIIERSNAALSFADDSSLEATSAVSIPTTATPDIIVKENNLYPAVGVYEIVLGLTDSLAEDLEEDIEASNEYSDFELDYLMDYPYTDLDYLNIGIEDYLSLETTVFPTVQIYVFVVDDNTVIEEGVVFYARNFRKAFTERASLTACVVKERAQARAYEVMTGLCLSENIFLDEEKLAEFVQSESLEPQDFTLSVPATSTPMSAEDAEAEEIPLVSTSIRIRTIDNRPPIEYIPTPPPRPPGNDSGNDNGNDIGNDNGNDGGGGSNGGSGSGGGNNNAGSSGSGGSSSGTAGTSNVNASGSGNERRPAWTSSVARSPVQVSPSTPSEPEGDSDEGANDEPQLTDDATASNETSPTPTPTPIQAAPIAEVVEGLDPLVRNALIAVGLTALVAAVIALYLYLQKKNLDRKKPPILQKS